MIYATMQRSPQPRLPYGAIAPTYFNPATNINDFWAKAFKFFEYSNEHISEIFGITPIELTEIRLNLFESGGLTPGHHYHANKFGIYWHQTSLWRLAVALGRSPVMPTIEPHLSFDLTTKQVASTANIKINKLYQLRKSDQRLIEGRHYRKSNQFGTYSYQWSITGLNQVIDIVGGDSNV